MRLLSLAAASLLGLAFGVGDSAARCLAYEPARVTLVGILSARTVPGPPDYRSIARGDYPETVFVLKLNEPICVSADPSSRSNWKGHSRVTEVQLLTRDVDPRRFLNQEIRVSGSIFSAHSGHHRTPVVLTVTKLRAA